MILQRIVELTERLDANPPEGYESLSPGYQKAFVTKIIRLKTDGSFRDIIPTTGSVKGKREGKFMLLPREAPQRTVGVVPRLIADNANYVLGKPREKDKSEDVAKRHLAFKQLVAECAMATKEPGVDAVSKWLSNGGPEQLRELPDITEDDEIAFEVDREYPTNLPAVKQYWAERGGGTEMAVCCVTGRHGPVVERMPAPIKGIPDGQVSGTALISVNNPAGESYGLRAALNSPIGGYAAERVGNGLNYLLESKQHSMRVGKAVYLYWTREPSDFSLNWLDRPEPAAVSELVKSAKSGSPVSELDENAFYVLCLSANVARIIIRDYHETTVRKAKNNLAKWFQKTALISQDGSPSKPFGLYRFASSLFRDPKDMPAHVPTSLLNSALHGTPLQQDLLGLAVKRNLAMQGPYAVRERNRYLCVERLALIKALLYQEEVNLESLKIDHPDSAYHCGRLLAVLERVQRAALGDINSTVVDRYYGSACASPGSILGTLVNDAQSHLGRLRKDKKSKYHEIELEDVLSSIGSEFPRTLNLQRQGLFALGFYHQKAHNRAQAAKHAADKAQGDTE